MKFRTVSETTRGQRLDGQIVSHITHVLLKFLKLPEVIETNLGEINLNEPRRQKLGR